MHRGIYKKGDVNNGSNNSKYSQKAREETAKFIIESGKSATSVGEEMGIDTVYSENIVNRKFNIEDMNKVWAGDITYIKTQTGWTYLSIVMDLFNR